MIIIKLNDLLDNMDRNLHWVSKKAGLPYSTVYNFANHWTNAVKYNTLEKICTLLDCNISDLIEFTKDEDMKGETNNDSSRSV